MSRYVRKTTSRLKPAELAMAERLDTLPPEEVQRHAKRYAAEVKRLREMIAGGTTVVREGKRLWLRFPKWTIATELRTLRGEADRSQVFFA